jgi:solute carrier family 25 (mitochondrial ornithine transporter) member 2/15
MQTFPHLYNNMVTCTLQTFRKDGVIRGLYAGTLPAIVANVAENSVLFAAYGGCQSLVAKVQGIDNLQNLTPLSNASAGFLAAFFSSFTLCPTELIKCKLQALREVQPTLKDGEKFQRITPFQLTRQIFKQQGKEFNNFVWRIVFFKSLCSFSGVSGFYRGLTSTFAREMPGYFFFFGGYEASRGFLAK